MLLEVERVHLAHSSDTSEVVGKISVEVVVSHGQMYFVLVIVIVTVLSEMMLPLEESDEAHTWWLKSPAATTTQSSLDITIEALWAKEINEWTVKPHQKSGVYTGTRVGKCASNQDARHNERCGRKYISCYIHFWVALLLHQAVDASHMARRDQIDVPLTREQLQPLQTRVEF